MDKLEEMQWCVVRQEDANETEGKGLKTVVTPALVHGAETWATISRGQQHGDKKHD